MVLRGFRLRSKVVEPDCPQIITASHAELPYAKLKAFDCAVC